MKTRSKRQVLWPAYFDIHLSRAEGRMVPKRFAVENPTCDEILASAERLKLDARLDREKSFPSHWWKKTGRVLVAKSKRKQEAVRAIAEEMRRARSVPRK
ncbi:MAG: signal recognition particle protein Srp19 [Euryarchaeota archaeon]|nr:signal recognition particle protein Srp19 [Euryarchaeota archaeon]